MRAQAQPLRGWNLVLGRARERVAKSSIPRSDLSECSDRSENPEYSDRSECSDRSEISEISEISNHDFRATARTRAGGGPPRAGGGGSQGRWGIKIFLVFFAKTSKNQVFAILGPKSQILNPPLYS